MPIKKSRLKPGSHIPQTHQQSSRRLQLTTFSNLCQRVYGASAMDRRRTQICLKCIYRIVQFSTILPLNMDQIVLLEYVVTAHDVHIKYMYFHRRLACKVELSSTLQASRRSMPGIDNCVGEKYLHMPQRCPRYVGGI